MRNKAIAILEHVRHEIAVSTEGDRDLIHQMRRYILKRLEFDERGTPTHRKKLKDEVRKRQHGLCAVCAEPLPERGAELDRLKAIEGYTAANTQLVCHTCHQRLQEERGFS